jgi:hypothetical protein
MSDDAKTDIEREKEEARQEIERLEEDPPAKLEDWPDGKAKYETFGGPEGEHSYAEGPETNLGPDSLRHHEDGSVTVEGEEADDPDQYKGEPIPGGPTDPNAAHEPAEPAERDDEPAERGESGEQGAPAEQGERAAERDG